jgi:hypothetical protein
MIADDTVHPIKRSTIQLMLFAGVASAGLGGYVAWLKVEKPWSGAWSLALDILIVAAFLTAGCFCIKVAATAARRTVFVTAEGIRVGPSRLVGWSEIVEED